MARGWEGYRLVAHAGLPAQAPAGMIFCYTITHRTPLGSGSAKEVAKKDLWRKLLPVTHPIVSVTCAKSLVGFSESDYPKREGIITDKVATIQDGLPMLKIVLYASANRRLVVSSALLQFAYISTLERTELIVKARKANCIKCLQRAPLPHLHQRHLGRHAPPPPLSRKFPLHYTKIQALIP